MKSSGPYLVVLSLLALPSLSTAGFGSGRKIPQVEAAVASIQSRFHAWVNFTGNKAAHLKTVTSKKESIQATSDYWLAQIKHQGVAPFAESGYQVFRNVQDFGATGKGFQIFTVIRRM
jgi:glucan 1,3-beta-glucosidase